MKTVIRSVVLSTLTMFSLIAQKLETQPPDQKKVLRVDTARDHLTVIELGDPVTMVAVGNQNAFAVERRDNKVFVRPIEEDARTNLFIWTTGGRYTYELVPATDVEQMHFAIDLAPTPVALNLPQAAPRPERPRETMPFPREMLAQAKPITIYGDRDSHGRVEVTLCDLYRQGTRLYLRYVLANHTGTPYLAPRPAVFHLKGVQSYRSLLPFGETQLGDSLVKSLKTENVLPVKVLDGDQVALIPTGGQGLGWLVIEELTEAGNESALRLEFTPDSKGPVSAVLILKGADLNGVSDAETVHTATIEASQR
jgi:hypothetical protein